MLCTTRAVFRCFKWMERAGDRITGAAGPFFVGMAVILLSTGVAAFFETVQPSLSYPWITTPICALIAFNLFAHYYFVCTVPPGFIDDPPREVGSSIFWAIKPKSHNTAIRSGVAWSEDLNITKASFSKCKRCGEVRPERAHHCRVCNRCVLKYDHHCPVRVNQCVGLHNERHFVLFLAYLWLSSMFFAVLGFPRLWHALGFAYTEWNYYTPEPVFICIHILACVIGLAVFMMATWHLWSVSLGETSVESHDHEQYRKIARSRDEAFVNSYDLGKIKNLQLFFNVGGNRYPWYSLLFPFRIHPYTDGRSWARRPGYQRHVGVKAGEELTSDEEGS